MKKVIALLTLLLFLTSCGTTIEVNWEFWEDSTDVQEYYIEDTVINDKEYEEYQIFNRKIIFYVQKDILENYLLMIDFDEGSAFVGLISNQSNEPVKGYYFTPEQWESEKDGFIYIDEFGGYYGYEWIFESTIDGDFITFTDEDNPMPIDMGVTESTTE